MYRVEDVRNVKVPNIGDEITVEYKAGQSKFKRDYIVEAIYPNYILLLDKNTGARETFLKAQILNKEIEIKVKGSK